MKNLIQQFVKHKKHMKVRIAVEISAVFACVNKINKSIDISPVILNYNTRGLISTFWVLPMVYVDALYTIC